MTHKSWYTIKQKTQTIDLSSTLAREIIALI